MASGANQRQLPVILNSMQENTDLIQGLTLPDDPTLAELYFNNQPQPQPQLNLHLTLGGSYCDDPLSRKELQLLPPAPAAAAGGAHLLLAPVGSTSLNFRANEVMMTYKEYQTMKRIEAKNRLMGKKLIKGGGGSSSTITSVTSGAGVGNKPGESVEVAVMPPPAAIQLAARKQRRRAAAEWATRNAVLRRRAAAESANRNAALCLLAAAESVASNVPLCCRAAEVNKSDGNVAHNRTTPFGPQISIEAQQNLAKAMKLKGKKTDSEQLEVPVMIPVPVLKEIDHGNTSSELVPLEVPVPISRPGSKGKSVMNAGAGSQNQTVENALFKSAIRDDYKMVEIGGKMVWVMPNLYTNGGIPNRRRIEGILYKYARGNVRIVCVCHGSFFTPRQFVKHAGGCNVAEPLKHIKIWFNNN